MRDTTKGIIYGGVITSAIVGELNACAALSASKRVGLIGSTGHILGCSVVVVGAWTSVVGGLYLSNKAIEYIESKSKKS